MKNRRVSPEGQLRRTERNDRETRQSALGATASCGFWRWAAAGGGYPRTNHYSAVTTSLLPVITSCHDSFAADRISREAGLAISRLHQAMPEGTVAS